MTAGPPLPDRSRHQPPPYVGAATMAALLRAHALGDHEGVRVIVESCDNRALIDRLLEAAMLLGKTRYGSREAMASALHDTLTFIATFGAGGS